MKPVMWVRSVAPDWAIVLGVAGAIGGAFAVLSVLLYREVSRSEGSAIPVESEIG
jgi:nucleoside phosphorylase